MLFLQECSGEPAGWARQRRLAGAIVASTQKQNLCFLWKGRDGGEQPAVITACAEAERLVCAERHALQCLCVHVPKCSQFNAVSVTLSAQRFCSRLMISIIRGRNGTLGDGEMFPSAQPAGMWKRTFNSRSNSV